MNKVVPTSLNIRHAPRFVQCDHDVTETDDDVGDIAEESLMRLCVRGAEYVIDVTSISCEPESRMRKLCERWQERVQSSGPRDRKSLFLNRNPAMFQFILDYHVTRQLHLPDGVCGSLLKAELKYWGIDHAMVAPCCLWKLREGMDTMKKMSEILNQYLVWDEMAKKANTWRERVWISHLLPFKSTLGKVMYGAQICLYILFLLSLYLQTMPEFRVPRPATYNITTTVPKLPMLQEYLKQNDLVAWLKIVEFVLLFLITFWVGFIFAACPNRKQHFGGVISLLNLPILLYQWFPTIMLVYDPPPDWYLSSIAYIDGGKIARVFPIITLLIPFRSMKIFGKALLLSTKELGLLVALILISVLIFGYVVFAVESSHDETHFTSVKDGIWWGIVTLTTVGYGDLYPQTFWGRTVGVICAIVGIVIIALPVPIIAGNFTKMYDLYDVIDYYRSVTVKSPKKRDGDRLKKSGSINNEQKTQNAECDKRGWNNENNSKISIII